MFGWILIILILLIAVLVFFVGIPLLVSSIVCNRKDRRMREEAEAHRKILDQTYDRIWSEVKKRCNIDESFRRSFNNVYPNIIDKDIDDNTLLNWILDCNIDFEPEQYPELTENIDADRKRFVLHQRRMLALQREHREMHQRWIPKHVLRDKSAIRYTPMATNYDRWGEKL